MISLDNLGQLLLLLNDLLLEIDGLLPIPLVDIISSFGLAALDLLREEGGTLLARLSSPRPRETLVSFFPPVVNRLLGTSRGAEFFFL
jgi:hypothetical protein